MRRAVTVRALAALILACISTVTTALAAPVCTFSSSSGLGFGAYDVFSGTAVSISGTLKFSCNAKTVPVTMTLDKGLHSSTFTNRELSDGAGDLLAYNIYVDAGHTQIWGDTTGGTSEFSVTTGAKNSTTTATLFGLMAAGQDAAVGSYADTVTATLNF